MKNDALSRFAMGVKWAKPAWWHHQLAELLPPAAVYGIFGSADLCTGKAGEKILVFSDWHRFKTAGLHLVKLQGVFGAHVALKFEGIKPKDDMPMADALIRHELKANHKLRGIETRSR